MWQALIRDLVDRWGKIRADSRSLGIRFLSALDRFDWDFRSARTSARHSGGAAGDSGTRDREYQISRAVSANSGRTARVLASLLVSAERRRRGVAGGSPGPRGRQARQLYVPAR